MEQFLKYLNKIKMIQINNQILKFISEKISLIKLKPDSKIIRKKILIIVFIIAYKTRIAIFVELLNHCYIQLEYKLFDIKIS